ncbi:MAG: N-acyl homoserine lactonase family protein [Gammaproteobacteria bacterium]|nr:N-acyl homoserine lactonase family protein [Gammaproteobacteria bacterium]MCY4356135.1 N-acyl homoserine lactonase family protein [Gammaproteobacteria bacterium]
MKILSIFIFAVFLSISVQAGPKLYIFDCGHLNIPVLSAFGLENDETPVRELFVPCYLIKHKGELMIWDAGLPLDMVGPRLPDANGWYESSIIDQLAIMKITPEDIDLVAYSHFHYDHVGAANAFARSKLLIQQTEFDAAFAIPQTNPVFRPELYDKLHESEKILLEGDYDVFGDGSVMIISAPGHTPGHQVLKIELEEFGPLVLSGDLYHFEASRRLRRTPVFNTSAEQTLESMDKVEALIEESGATFWIEHNLELAQSLELAPDFYE